MNFSEQITSQGVCDALEDQLERHVDGLERNLAVTTSRSVCKVLQTSWKELKSGNTETSGEWAQIALDYSWERLNMGNWEDVSLNWRRVYATAALLRAVGQVKEKEVEKALETLDRGILLGAPILDSALHKLASSLATSSTHLTPHDSPKTEHPGSELSGIARDPPPPPPKPAKKVVFRNYKPTHDSNSDDTVKIKRPRVEVNVHDLVSRTANVPLIDQKRRIPVVYLPSLGVFHRDHMLTHTPVVLSGVLDTWPAYSARKWRYIHLHTATPYKMPLSTLL